MNLLGLTMSFRKESIIFLCLSTGICLAKNATNLPRSILRLIKRGSTLWPQSFPFEKSTNRTSAQYAFRITYGSSQSGKTSQRMHSQHEAREKIFALNLYLRKKANKPSFVRAKVEGEFRTTPRFRVGDGRPGGRQVQDRDELIAKAHEVAEGP